MRVLFLWFYPAPHLGYLAHQHPEWKALAYVEHRNRLMTELCHWPPGLCRHVQALGVDAEFVLGDCRVLQEKWAAENAFRPRESPPGDREVALEQIRRFQPDVLLMGTRFDYCGDFTRAAARHVRRIALWVGEPWPPPPDLSGVSVLITENPRTFSEVRSRFEKVVITHPVFLPNVLEMLGPVRKTDTVVFAGQFSWVHRRRSELVAHLIRNGIPIVVHGTVDGENCPRWFEGSRLAAWYLVKRRDVHASGDVLRRTFRPSAAERDADAVRSICREPLFGADMFRALAGARAVLNVHGDIAGRHAGNTRMFEATGVGSCLVTEHADNIENLFIPGEEALTYRTADELAELLRRGLRDPARLDRIGRAGQARTLREHTVETMWRDICPAFGS